MTQDTTHAANGGTRSVTIDATDYLAHRVLADDGRGTGSIDLEEAASAQLVAQASYDGSYRSIRLETLRGPIPRAVVRALLELAEEGLA